MIFEQAYSLASNGGDAFGREVIRTLLTEVENHRSDLLVILAGYEQPMEELMDADPGLRSRFNTRLHLKDYSCNEISQIAERTAKKKTFTFDKGLLTGLCKQMKKIYTPLQISQENGRMAVNLVERAIEKLATRLINSGMNIDEIRAAQSILTLKDFKPNRTETKQLAKENARRNQTRTTLHKSKPPILTIHPQQLLQTPHPPHLRPPQSPQSPFTSEIVEGVINSLHPPQFIASSFSSSINQKFIPERIRPNRIRDGDGDNEEKFRPTQELIALPKVQVQEDDNSEEDTLQVMYLNELIEISCRLENDSVLDLKRHIENVLGIECSQFCLELNGNKLDDKKYLEDLKLRSDEEEKEESHIQVICGLFAQMANYSRVGFAIDVSGSMGADVGANGKF